MNLEQFKAIISAAIKDEETAYEFYKSVSEKVKDANIKSLFKNFADEELKHKELLNGFLSGAAKTMQFDTGADYKVSETVDKPNLSIEMKPADAIALAMKNEEEAMKLYTDFANLSTDNEQKELFQNLAKMEQGHKAKLEDLYVNAAFGEVW
jgi:rubrerythrin